MEQKMNMDVWTVVGKKRHRFCCTWFSEKMKKQNLTLWLTMQMCKKKFDWYFVVAKKKTFWYALF